MKCLHSALRRIVREQSRDSNPLAARSETARERELLAEEGDGDNSGEGLDGKGGSAMYDGGNGTMHNGRVYQDNEHEGLDGGGGQCEDDWVEPHAGGYGLCSFYRKR